MTGTAAAFSRTQTLTRRTLHPSAFATLMVAAAFLSVCFPCHADEASAAVAKPQVKVGDRYSYRTTNYLARTEIVGDSRVASVGPDEIVLSSKRRGTEVENDSHWTSEWNSMVVGNLVITPHLGHFKFPLKAGATHVAVWEGHVKGSAWRAKYQVPFKATGWEDVTVPAGKFRALKLEGKGNFNRLDQGGGGWVHLQYWYVPEVKRWVRYTWQQGSGGPNQYDNNILLELLEFSVQ